MNKVYGVYFAYSVQDFFPKEVCDLYPTDYPRDIARVHMFANASQQLDAYANVMCPASQLVTANSKKEFDEKIEQLKNNFENPEWVSVHIDPYC